MKTIKRKLDHLNVCLSNDVQSGRSNGFEKFELVHNALPEIDREDIDITTKFLGKDLSAPLFIEAMTGGTGKAATINKNLAKAAQELGVGLGVGSQRAMIEDPKLSSSYDVRGSAPYIFLAGNIGAAQINEFGVEKIIHAADTIKADAICVHLNPAQEIAQHDGHCCWKGAITGIKELCYAAEKPVIVKEVGSGISAEVADLLEDAGADAIDVAGVGGTSWVKVDSLITGKSLENFFDWGIPTAESLMQCVHKVKVPVISSGGIRNGIDAAKSIAMGASLVGLALPLLKPATISSDAVKDVINRIIDELKVSMFLTGSENLLELRGRIVKSD
jgi:isopentenyl-diphosphate delta-isomerase